MHVKFASENWKQNLQAEIASRNCKQRLQARFEFKISKIHSVWNWVTDRVWRLVWVTIFSKILTSDGHYSCIISSKNRTILGHYFFYQTQFYGWNSSQKQNMKKFFMILMQNWALIEGFEYKEWGRLSALSANFPNIKLPG